MGDDDLVLDVAVQDVVDRPVDAVGQLGLGLRALDALVVGMAAGPSRFAMASAVWAVRLRSDVKRSTSTPPGIIRPRREAMASASRRPFAVSAESC